MGVIVGAVEADDAGRFLAAVLQRVEAERDEAGSGFGAPDSENAALLAQLVVVERIGGQHFFARIPGVWRHIGEAARICRLPPVSKLKHSSVMRPILASGAAARRLLAAARRAVAGDRHICRRRARPAVHRRRAGQLPRRADRVRRGRRELLGQRPASKPVRAESALVPRGEGRLPDPARRSKAMSSTIGQVPAACAYYCGPGATLAGKAFNRSRHGRQGGRPGRRSALLASD